MLKRITTAGVALAAIGALGLGGSVIASANPAKRAQRHGVRVLARSHAADAGETPGNETDTSGGANVQSGSQSGSDTTSPTAAKAGTERSDEAPSTETDASGGANVQSGPDVQRQGPN